MSHKMLEKDRPGKLFVGGLAEDVDEKALEKEFSKYGRVTEVLVIRDKVRQISRGFGFVTYENPIDAEDAIKGMEGKELQGKKLHVEDAVRGGTMSDSSSRFSRDGGYGGRDGGFSRGRSRGGPPRGRGGPPLRGRGGFPPRDGPPRDGPPPRDMPPRGSGYGGRGGSFSRGGRGSMMPRGRGSPPPMRRDDSPPRKGPLISRGPPPPGRGRTGFESSRGRPMSGFDSRRDDRYDSGFSDRGPPPRSRDVYPPSPPRDTGRGTSLMDSRMPPSRSSRDYPPSSRDYPPSSRDYPPSRDYPSQRDYSPERGGGAGDRYSYRDSYPPTRDDRGDSYSRGGRGDYDSPRDSYTPRGGGGGEGGGYSSMSSRDYREPISTRGGDRFDRDFDSGPGSSRFSRDVDSRGPPRGDYDMHRDSGPPSRGYGGSGSAGPSGSRGPPPFSSSRGPYPSGGERRSSGGDRDSFTPGARRPAGPPPSRGPPPPKRPRSDGPPSRGPPPPSFRR